MGKTPQINEQQDVVTLPDASFYDKIKNVPTVANSTLIDKLDDADLFRDGFYIGEYDTELEGVSLPVLIPVNRFGSLCIIDNGSNRVKIHNFLQACAYRILGSINPSLCKCILYDGVGMGRDLISLSGLDNRIKGDKILTSPAELNRALEKLSDRITYVIQNVLGSKFANSSLTDYNRDAGDAAEQYYFLFITNYPTGLKNEQCQLIERIVKAGPQAGVYAFISYFTDASTDPYVNRDAKEILKYTSNIVLYKDNKYLWHNVPNQEIYNSFSFTLASQLPRSEQFNYLFDKISNELKKAEDVTVDIISEMTSTNFWNGNATSGIDVPIGKQNISTLQYFSLSGEINHVLIGGATGSGKSVLLHNIISNTAWLYSPEEVQMILLDYKEGTEFNVYENLPHARVLSVQSEREFGCSVFRFIDEEITRRGEAFKAIGAVNLKTYNQKSDKPLPRILVIVDEFQKLLDGDTKTTAFVSHALGDIGRRGRSFGINLILSTQSLSNVDISAVQPHLGLRIVLHLNTQYDCDRFLSNSNYVPYTSLTRPGQAIYNSRAGLTEGNVQFQTAFIDEKSRKHFIDNISAKSRQIYNGQLAPYTRFFYDGTSSAEITHNKDLAKYNKPNDRFCTIFIGEPASLSEEHLSFKIKRQNGSNILIVGSDESSALSILTYSTLQILNQSQGDAKIVIADKTNVDSQYYGTLQKSLAACSNAIEVYELDQDIELAISDYHAELQQRIEERKPGARWVLILNDLYNIRSLRKKGHIRSQFAQMVQNILKDGPLYGIHVILYATSFENFTQIFDTFETLPEFDIKIELCGGRGYRIFGNCTGDDRALLRPQSNSIANLQIGDSENIVKFKVYRNTLC